MDFRFTRRGRGVPRRDPRVRARGASADVRQRPRTTTARTRRRSIGEAARAFQRKLSDKGWLTLAWPKQHGGLGAGPMQQLVYNEEMSRAARARVRRHGRGDGRPDADDARHGRAARALPRPHRPQRDELVPGLQRAGRRLRPRIAADARRAGRRRVRRQRAEDLDVRRAARRLLHPARAHRPRGAEASRHQLLPDGHEVARHHDHAADEHAELGRVQPDVPRQRAHPAREPRRRDQPRLVRRDDDARLRALRHPAHRLRGDAAR